MAERITSVTVVGGGDAGLLAALAVRTANPDLEIEVVDDVDESPTNVGKSTYQAIVPLLHSVLEIDEGRFLQEVKPVWKGSVYFRDWCGNEPFHYAFDIRSVKPDVGDPRSVESLYHYYDTQTMSTPAEGIVEQRKAPLVYSPAKNTYVGYSNMAYHLSIDRFNDFLRTLCRERDIALVDDRITDVRTNADDDRIEQVSSQSATYRSDLYVDATGFKRLLMGKLEAAYESFDIPLDTALHATADLSIEEIVPATVVETGEYGWFWQIDTFDDRDLGYVFASEYVSEEEALAEFEAHREEELRDVERYQFDSGFYEDAWVGNCVATGNALGFVEPLQSTALTTHLSNSIRLSHLLASHGRINNVGIRDSFNRYIRGTWNSVYDFISVHYAFADGDNAFWEAMQSIPLSERVEQYIEYYDRNGIELYDSELVTEEGTELSMLTFPTSSLYLIMRNMGATSSFYENHDFTVSEEIKERWRQRNAFVERLADECLTYEEVYKSGLVETYIRNERAFAQAAAPNRQ